MTTLLIIAHVLPILAAIPAAVWIAHKIQVALDASVH